MSDTHEQGSVFVDDQTYRLPTSVTPERYQIRLTPNLKTFTFAGEETITLSIHEPVKEISFNAAELTISQATVTGVDGKAIVATVRLDDLNERATCIFPQTLAPGSWQLHLQFSGILNDKLHGFYRSTYKLSLIHI